MLPMPMPKTDRWKPYNPPSLESSIAAVFYLVVFGFLCIALLLCVAHLRLSDQIAGLQSELRSQPKLIAPLKSSAQRTQTISARRSE